MATDIRLDIQLDILYVQLSNYLLYYYWIWTLDLDICCPNPRLISG